MALNAKHQKVSGWGKLGSTAIPSKGSKPDYTMPGLPGKTIKRKTYEGPNTAKGTH